MKDKREARVVRILTALVLAWWASSGVMADQTFDCYSEDSCPYHATCNGDYVGQSGCSIQCYVALGGGYIGQAGSASCQGASGGHIKDPTP